MRFTSVLNSIKVTFTNHVIKAMKPAERAICEAAVTQHAETDANLKTRGTAVALVKSTREGHDPRTSDTNHWTVEFKKENGDHITTRHVYPRK
ncbi:hypothetical protein B0A55_11928 [Friedmanniomyces simplex]|uniref:Uncharacterized protein n=1 Tax=Friedmanniomyces simplex TaxID=329884 RepID=A0A4U0VLA9_9PEZI|nr:hypothetical protein B0A55_11928 [Friedmanniomyces simplex]